MQVGWSGIGWADVDNIPKMGGIAMLDNVVKLLDVIEDLINSEDAIDPRNNDKLVSIGSRLEALCMDIKDKTEPTE